MKATRAQGSKILIVDDNPTNLEILSQYLSLSGHSVFVKKSGLAALESLEFNRPDIILLDVVMPEIDGFETCRRLKANDRTKDIPVIFMTALSETQDKLKGFKLGAVDYITKPIQQEEVLERVNTHLVIQNLQKELQQKNDVLQNALERERRLMSDLRLSLSLALPHELRTPLTVILGFSSLLTGMETLPTPEQIVQYGNSIYQNSLRLYRLIENALIYANLKLLKYSSDEKPLPQSDITRHIGRLIHLIAEPKAVEAERGEDLVIDVEDAAIQAGPTHFEKIFTELLDNALKNSPKGTTIELKASVENGQWTLRISDQGRGMSQEQIANIGAFIQFDRARHEQQGLGLGLTIAQLLTQLEGGTLTIESGEQQGTTAALTFRCDAAFSAVTTSQDEFWFEQPLPSGRLFQREPEAPHREIQGYKRSSPKARHLCKILSIDRYWVNSEALGQLLTPLGFEVIEAFDEFDGVNKIISASPDAILWDASGTEENAVEFVEQIRHSFLRKPTKIIALTTQNHNNESLRKLRDYCDAIWKKPVSVQTLLEEFPRLLDLQWIYT